MKTKNKTLRPTTLRRRRTHPDRPAHLARFPTPRPQPGHDLLAFAFYPGMRLMPDHHDDAA